MNLNPTKILIKNIRVRSLILFALLMLYIGLSLVLFFKVVDPTLDGRVDRRIAADSITYITAADALREGRDDIFLTVAFSSFPNTVLSPIMLALIFKTTFGMVLGNYAMFFFAINLLKRSFSFSTAGFIALLLINATTTISLLSVNKEIVDFLAVSIFFYARVKHRNGVLALALLLAAFNRWEVCIVMLAFLIAESKLNPWRHRRFVTIGLLVGILSLALPRYAPEALSTRLMQITDARTFAMLDTLVMHYLFALAVIPKILFVLFGVLIAHPFSLSTYYTYAEPANSIIPYSNNLANVAVFAILFWRHRFTLRSNLVYFAIFGFILMAVSPLTVQRYVYFAYVLLCLQATRTDEDDRDKQISVPQQAVKNLDAGLPDNQEAAFG